MRSTACTTLIVGLAASLALAGTVAAADPAGLLQPQALSYVGIDALRRIEPDLTGQGVRYALVCRSMTYIGDEPQNDYRPDGRHRSLRDMDLQYFDAGEIPAGVSAHSTAICSILLGYDPEASAPSLGCFAYHGVVPGASASVYEFRHFVTKNVHPLSAPDADILAASMGRQFEYWWTRGIEAMVEHAGLIVVASIGNGLDAHDPPLYPGAGSNVIGVGVVSSVNTADPATNLAHFALAYPERSTSGPTLDGRCKPDIIAPGNCLVATPASENSYEMGGNCSSYSTPVVAGVIGQLLQKAKSDERLALAASVQGRTCLLKAILMNSATKLPYWHKGRLETDDDHLVPLDYVQGAGMVNALAAYDQLVAGRHEPGQVAEAGWDLNRLQADQTPQQVYRIQIGEPTDKVVTATLAWNRHYQSTYPFKRIAETDTNLRVELWAINPDGSGSDYLLDYSDSAIDNVEHIHCKTLPGCADYELIVSYSRTEPQPAEQYALAWSATEAPGADSIFWHDLNADGIVDASDLAVLLNSVANRDQSSADYVMGDVNADGVLDADDLRILLDHRDRTADWHVPGSGD